YVVTLTATDKDGGVGTDSQTITVDYVLSPATLPNGTYGSAYTQTLTATEPGHEGAFTFAVTAGELPTGLSLSSAGALSRTPVSPWSRTFSFTVPATDSSGLMASHSYTIRTSPAQTVSSVVSSLNPSMEGQSVTFTATVSGADPSALLPLAGIEIQFWDAATVLGFANLDDAGHATFTLSTLAAGNHDIYVLYNGNDYVES